MDALSDSNLFSFSKKIQDGHHDVIFADFSKMVQSSLNFAQISPLVCILIICCFHIDRKFNMAAISAILIFSRNFLPTTPPAPQVVETWGLHHKVQFSLQNLPL